MNTVVLISFSAWAVAQLAKVLVVLLSQKELNFRYFVSSGGMPSAHSATVCALATAIAGLYGFDSVSFAIAVVLAIIVMYDSAGVRQSVSKQSKILNRIVAELSKESGRANFDMEHELRVLIGHTPFQVIVGALLGVLVALVWLTAS